MSGFALSFKLQPDSAFVRGNDFAARRLTYNREVCFELARSQRARAGLERFFVDQSRKNDFSLSGAVARSDHLDQSGKHGRDAAFGVASATAIKTIALKLRREHRARRANGIHVRRQNDSTLRLRRRPITCNEIGARWLHLPELGIQTAARRYGGQEFRHALLARVRVIGRKERRVNARQRDQFPQQLFRFRHFAVVRAASFPVSPCKSCNYLTVCWNHSIKSEMPASILIPGV